MFKIISYFTASLILLSAVHNRAMDVPVLARVIRKTASGQVVINITTNDALLYAAQDNNDWAVKKAFEYGARKDCRNADGFGPVRLAAHARHKDMVNFLVDTYNCDVDERDIDGMTPLHEAVIRDDKEMATFLIEKGAMPCTLDYDGLSTLHQAAYRDNVDMLLLLISHIKKEQQNIEINRAGTTDGMTPYLYAVMANARNAAMVLKEHGADVHVKTKEGESAVHLAARANAVNLLTELLDKEKIDPEQKNVNGLTGLGIAVGCDNAETVDILLRCGSKQTICSQGFRFPLIHFAAGLGACKVATLLLEKWGFTGNETMQFNQQLATPYGLAVRNSRGDMCKLLQEKGAGQSFMTCLPKMCLK